MLLYGLCQLLDKLQFKKLDLSFIASYFPFYLVAENESEQSLKKGKVNSEVASTYGVQVVRNSVECSQVVTEDLSGE